VYVFGNKPIYSQQDLKGPKVWLWEGDVLAEAYFRALGVSPIPMSITDVLTALQTNMIELVYSPPLACVTLQWHTRVKYMMDVPLADVAGAVLISKKMFDKMPESYQTILREQGKKHMRKLVELSRQDNEKSIELMRNNDIEIISVPPENLEEFYSAGQQARQNLVGKLYPQELLDRVENLLTEYREKKE
jgi:TRAP-type C4-dicarboxylate transport system substrate-binding protein